MANLLLAATASTTNLDMQATIQAVELLSIPPLSGKKNPPIPLLLK